MPLPDIPIHPLPTLSRLGHDKDFASTFTDPNFDALSAAKGWFDAFNGALSITEPSLEDLKKLLLPDVFWRDLLALTWDFRTLQGHDKVLALVNERVGDTKQVQIRNAKVREKSVSLQAVTPDLLWIQFLFDFEVGEVGKASGVVRIVPVTETQWAAHAVFTNLEGLLKHPERIGALRDQTASHGDWEGKRLEEIEFGPGVEPPQVVIVGAGHSGLQAAARLKYLGVRVLVVEKNARVGDSWRQRYDTLTLHDPVYTDHFAYLPFPPTWPKLAPGRKLANWIEHYAEILDLNVWVSSTVTSVNKDTQSDKWEVSIIRDNGEQRKFVVNHVVFATGLSSGAPSPPTYPGQDEFKGQILHSSAYKRAGDYVGKRVLVVGACTSAHDIAEDCYKHDIDVTMFQRGSSFVMSVETVINVLLKALYSEDSPPVEFSDRIFASMAPFASIELLQMFTQITSTIDKELLDSLNKVGFRTNTGVKGTGINLLAWSKGGGYYLDTGTSTLIIDGKIKLKSGGEIEGYEDGQVVFQDGSKVAADVVIFATGIDDAKVNVRRLCGDEVADRFTRPVFALDDEGEVSLARHSGVDGLWYMLGNLSLSRFYSMHLALQIKAIEEGLYGTRYEARAQ